jgi:hypothetical protein
MSTLTHKDLPLFLYLGILQLITALCALIVSLLFIKFAEGSDFDFIASFLPDVSLMMMSIVGILMLMVQVLGSLIGGIVSLVKMKVAGKIAMLLGGAEALWMVYQFIMLHMHHVLILLFFVLSFAQMIIGYLLSEKIREVKKAIRDNIN